MVVLIINITHTNSSHEKQVLEQHQLAAPVAWKESMMQIMEERYTILPRTLPLQFILHVYYIMLLYYIL